MLPKSFFPCFAPLPSVAIVGTPSSNSRVGGGRLKRTQRTQVPRGASGSSQIRAMLLVPVGGSDQRNAGDRFAPSPVYCFGMVAPCWNAVLVSSMDIGESPDCVSFDVGLHPKPKQRQGRASISGREDLSGKPLGRNHMAATSPRPAIMACRSCPKHSPFASPFRSGWGVPVAVGEERPVGEVVER